MAEGWIKMRGGLETDPAVVAIAEALQMDVDAVIGKLYRFWKWADSQTANGHIRGATTEWIDRFLRAETISKNFSAVGWLRVTPDGITIPKFTRHNGQSAKRRALTAVRVAKHRAKKCNAPIVTKVLPEKIREEKIREEEIHTPLTPLFDATDSPPANGEAKKKKKAEGDLPYVFAPDEIPDSLRTPEFLNLWPEWVAQRSKKRGGLNRRSARMQLADCEQWGPEKAVRALRKAIGGNYAGLFEPEGNSNGHKPPSGVTPDQISQIAAKVAAGRIA